ncbi:MAG: heparinase, partial [Flavicella sp.]|nr:heparinase [Flavicella sp.]
MKQLYVILFSLLVIISCNGPEKTKNTKIDPSGHPRLILTKEGVKNIRDQLGNIPIFDNSLQKVKEEVDAEILAGIEIPIPKDYSGGYTHSR